MNKAAEFTLILTAVTVFQTAIVALIVEWLLP